MIPTESTGLGKERFLHPSASFKATVAFVDEQTLNADMENNPIDGWAATDVTLARLAATRFRGGAAIRVTKDLAAGTGGYISQDVEPPRKWMIPDVRRIVGPSDHLKSEVLITDDFVTVQNIDLWPDEGTASFEHALRNSGGSRPIEEFSWLAKSGDQLINVQRNIRNENNLVTIEKGDYLVGTTYLRRVLIQVAVMNTNNADKVLLEAHPQYDNGGGGYSFAGTGIFGPSVTMPLNEWTMMELVYDFHQFNLDDPTNNPATRLQIRASHHSDNAIGAQFFVDEFRVYHLLELQGHGGGRDDDPTDTIVDVGEVFERTAGGLIRSNRVRPATKRTGLQWGKTNPLPRELKDQLVSWHQDLCYPAGITRSFDFQRIGRDRFVHGQEEVVWVDSAPAFRESGPNNEWTIAIPLEHVASDTTGVHRGGLK